MSESAHDDIVCRCSGLSVAEAVNLLKKQLHERNIPLFAEFDHKANAVGAGMDMPGATVLVFGNPAVGTGLMLKAPSLALDLPLRILIREEKAGCCLSYRDVRALAREHGLDEQDDIVRKLNGLLHTLVQSVF